MNQVLSLESMHTLRISNAIAEINKQLQEKHVASYVSPVLTEEQCKAILEQYEIYGFQVAGPRLSPSTPDHPVGWWMIVLEPVDDAFRNKMKLNREKKFQRAANETDEQFDARMSAEIEASIAKGEVQSEAAT